MSFKRKRKQIFYVSFYRPPAPGHKWSVRRAAVQEYNEPGFGSHFGEVHSGLQWAQLLLLGFLKKPNSCVPSAYDITSVLFCWQLLRCVRHIGTDNLLKSLYAKSNIVQRESFRSKLVNFGGFC